MITIKVSEKTDKKSGLAEIRFWYNKKLAGIQTVKNDDLIIPNF